MKTLQVNISEESYKRFGFPSPQIDFDALLKTIKKELAKEALRKCQQIAAKTSLSDMTLEEINAEINATRHAKNRS